MSDVCVVSKEIDYYREAIELTFRIVNGITYSDLEKDMLKRTDPKEHEKLKVLLRTLGEVEEEIKPYIAINDKKIQFYFKQFVLEELCLAKILYQGMSHTVIKGSLEERKEILYEYLERIVEDDTLELTLSDGELIVSTYEDGLSYSFVRRIEQMECEDSKKWMLLYVMKEARVHIEQLFSCIEPIVKRLKKKKKILENLINTSANYWEAYFKEKSFITLISNFYGLTENSYKELTSYIRPQIMMCDKVIFMGNDENMGDYHILDIGISFDEEFRATKNRPTKEQICNGLKLLSDPSKFEILKFINKKKAYGQEIAAKTNLTTATISHHMNTLMGFGFITIEKVDNKVYYQMNHDAICNFLEAAKDLLFKETSYEKSRLN